MDALGPAGPMHLWLLLLALALDALLGDPDWLWRRLPHPVVLCGRAIGVLERRLNPPAWSEARRRLGGLVLLVLLVAGGLALGTLLHVGLARLPFGWLGEIVVAAVMLAQRSLYDHVAAVAAAFRDGGLAAARGSVARIVGRDPAALDEAGVSRAAVESLAENLSDGIVAPALWYALLGLPGLFAYKAVNTADSMVGHRSPRHEAFGWAAARFDDLVNLPASRLTALLLALAASPRDTIAALRAVRRDARHHRSPNAGWPEAATAGALGLALAGPRVYAEGAVEDAWMNPGGRRAATPADIRRALRLTVRALALLWLLVLVGALSFG